jgi:selenocysteine-specific elongation factor
MTESSKSIVIATAGHIDHGKTTLVRSLTGIDADRLPEEKRRGITIDLGFASFELPASDGSSIRVSFVDVPGHSLFIRNMLAGTGCVPAVMLIIAANEGVMPQTVEHLRICELLGISQGFTVITKIDTVNALELQQVTNSIEEFLQTTFLGKDRAPVIQASSETGEALPAVRSALINLAIGMRRQTSDALMRMPIDRSFVMKGFGTVVTGTLLSGTVIERQILQLQPGSNSVRVRGLQAHGRSQPSVQSGGRVALNLSGVDAAEIRRGQTLTQPETVKAVDVLDVEVRLLEGAVALKHRAKVHFHAFTSQSMANIYLFGYEPVQPGTLRLMRIKLTEPIVLLPDDRFVLRQPSPVGTIGGGRVLDAYPTVRQKKAVTLAWLEQLQAASTTQQITLRIGRRKTSGASFRTLSIETGLTVEAIRRHLEPALHCGDVLLISGDMLISREVLVSASDVLLHRLQGSQPIKSSEVLSSSGFKSELFEFVIESLVRKGRIELRGEMVLIRNAGAPPSNSDTETLAVIAQIYKIAGLASPLVMEVAERLNLKEAEMRRHITALQRTKAIVRMGSDDLFIHSEALDRLVALLAPMRGALINVARFKELAGVSRKYAIPLLEYLDRQRITRKQDDLRLIL